MQIRKIVPTLAITAITGLCSCTKNTAKCDISNQDSTNTEIVKAPLTQDFLGMRVEYKSKDDSIKANHYLRKAVENAIPLESEYDDAFDRLLELNQEKYALYDEGNIKGAKTKELLVNKQYDLLDSLWNLLIKKTIPADSLNQYTVKSDFKDGESYLYDWFKEGLTYEE